MKILFISRWFPYPASNGSKLRIYNLLRSLAQQHEVSLLSFVDQPKVVPNITALCSICREVQVVPWKPFNPNSWSSQLGFLDLAPRSVIDTFSPEMKQRLDHMIAVENYDLVIASQFDMAVYGQCFRHLPALFEEVEAGVLYQHFTHAISPWDRLRHGLTWVKHRHYLACLLRHFRACTVASEQERQLLAQVISDYEAVEIIPNCINVADYDLIHETAQPDTLIFTGSFSYFPNYEAMVWFIGEVYPRIQAQVPDIKLIITGDHGNRSLPPARNVILTGMVDDVRPLISRSWASVVPLHTGGGTRLKILEAMALGTPVIATSKGAEGLQAQEGQHLLIADTPEAFTEHVIRLLREPALRQQLANNAYQLVREKYDWAVITPQFLELVERVAHI
jgi:glycosyltransferase involved in cell wall biosynthesis